MASSHRVLVTGANGRTSRHVVRALLDAPNPPPLRLLVHSGSSISALKSDFSSLASQDSPHEIIVADYLVPSELRPALTGIHTVFYNGPAFASQETAMGIAMIDMAKECGVQHFVFCSVLHALRSKMLNHKVKLPCVFYPFRFDNVFDMLMTMDVNLIRVEEYLIESNLNYTILQPTHMMQNTNLANTLRSSNLSLPYSPSTLQGFLDLHDLAEVTRSIIASTLPSSGSPTYNPELHNRARYELLGENRLYTDVAKVIARAAGKDEGAIGCQQIPRADVLKMAPPHFQTDYAQDAFARMLFYYDQRYVVQPRLRFVHPILFHELMVPPAGG